MEANLKGPQSLSFSVNTFYDVAADGIGYVKHSEQSKVHISMPDRLIVEKEGDKGLQIIVYDGKRPRFTTRPRISMADWRFRDISPQ